MRRAIFAVVGLLWPAVVFGQSATLIVSDVPTPSASCTIQRNAGNTAWVCTAGAAASQPLTDSLGLIADNGDPTKVLAFEVSAIATATTRTITWPNANVTIPSTVASLSTNTFTGLQTANGGVATTTFTMSSTMQSDLTFTDATYDIGKTGATRPRDLFLSRNLVVGGTTTHTGNIVSDLLFTDATYDIGKSGATRPRDGFFSRNGVFGGTLGVTGNVTFSGTGNAVGTITSGVWNAGAVTSSGTVTGVAGAWTGRQTMTLANAGINAYTVTSSTGTNAAGYKAENTGGVLYLSLETSAHDQFVGGAPAYTAWVFTNSSGGLALGAVTSSTNIDFYAGGSTVTARNKGSDSKFYTNDGTVSSLSDERTKDRVGEFTAGLEAIRGIVTGSPGSLGVWRYKTGDVTINGQSVDYPRSPYPFVTAGAQTVQRFIPEAVTPDEHGVLTLNTSPIWWATARGLVELSDRVAALETRTGAPAPVAVNPEPAHRRYADLLTEAKDARSKQLASAQADQAEKKADDQKRQRIAACYQDNDVVTAHGGRPLDCAPTPEEKAIVRAMQMAAEEESKAALVECERKNALITKQGGTPIACAAR